jgi:hypothetical protein
MEDTLAASVAFAASDSPNVVEQRLQQPFPQNAEVQIL